MRVDAPLYFANVQFVRDKVRRTCFGGSNNSSGKDGRNKQDDGNAALPQTNGDGMLHSIPRFFVLEMGPVITCDSSGAHAMKDVVEYCKKRGVQVCMSNPNGNVLRVLESAGVINVMGRDWLFMNVHEAIQACLQDTMDAQRNGAGDQGKLHNREGRRRGDSKNMCLGG